MRFLLWVVVNALALAAAAALIDGITVTGADDVDRVVTLLLVALVFGLVNAVVRPVVKLLALPFIILTLGLLIFVINAAMLLLTEWISQQFDLGFSVADFSSALLGALVVMIATWGLELVLGDGRDR